MNKNTLISSMCKETYKLKRKRQLCLRAFGQISVPSSQFHCEPKTTLKKISL